MPLRSLASIVVRNLWMLQNRNDKRMGVWAVSIEPLWLRIQSPMFFRYS